MILELINRKLRARKDSFSPLPSTMYSKNKSLGTPPGVPTVKGATAEPENTHEATTPSSRSWATTAYPMVGYNGPSATPCPARLPVRPCSGTRPKTPTTCSRVTAACLPTPRTRTSSSTTPTTSLYILHHRRQGQRRPVRRLPALRRTACGRALVHGGDAV